MAPSDAGGRHYEGWRWALIWRSKTKRKRSKTIRWHPRVRAAPTDAAWRLGPTGPAPSPLLGCRKRSAFGPRNRTFGAVSSDTGVREPCQSVPASTAGATCILGPASPARPQTRECRWHPTMQCGPRRAGTAGPRRFARATSATFRSRQHQPHPGGASHIQGASAAGIPRCGHGGFMGPDGLQNPPGMGGFPGPSGPKGWAPQGRCVLLEPRCPFLRRLFVEHGYLGDHK